MSYFAIDNFHAARSARCGMVVHVRDGDTCTLIFTLNRIFILAVCLIALCAGPDKANAQCLGTGCGVAGDSVNALLSIPAGIAASLRGPSTDCYGSNCCRDNNCCNTHCGCGLHSWCGPVGGAVNRLLAIPASVLGSLTSYTTYSCGTCRDNHEGCVHYPRGCAARCRTGTAADVAPRKTVVTPSYITYSIVDTSMPVRPVPPVVTFNGPLAFEQ